MRGGGGGALRACLLEVLRLGAHSIGGIRKVLKEGGWQLTVGGRQYTIPRGSFVGASHVIPNRDKAVFAEPHRFDPARWLPAPTSPQSRFSDFQFTTFSHGVHRCPGEHFGMQAMEMLLVAILSKYTLTAPGAIPPLCMERATLSQRKAPCLLHVSKRW